MIFSFYRDGNNDDDNNNNNTSIQYLFINVQTQQHKCQLPSQYKNTHSTQTQFKYTDTEH